MRRALLIYRRGGCIIRQNKVIIKVIFMSGHNDNHGHAPPRFPHEPELHAAPRPHTHGGHTHTHAQTKAVIDRISRAAGHLTAVRGMVQDGRDCSEVLTQLAAVRAALNRVCEIILSDHIDHCIVDAVKTGDMDAVAELNKAIRLLMK